jgi:hypothetical protein
MDVFLSTVISYFVSLAVNEHSASIHKRREAKLIKLVENEKTLLRSINSKKSLREEVGIVCTKLAQDIQEKKPYGAFLHVPSSSKKLLIG